jgi:hypothetical protein
MAEGEGYEPFSRERKLAYKASLATQLVHPPHKNGLALPQVKANPSKARLDRKRVTPAKELRASGL